MGSIRFLLAFSVLILHSSPIAGIRLLPGETAVRTFYIISGFYMTLIFSTKYASATRPYYSFITNRWLRLYPPYLVVVLLIGVLSVAYGIWLGSFGKIQYYLDWYRQVPESLSSLLTVLFFNISRHLPKRALGWIRTNAGRPSSLMPLPSTMMSGHCGIRGGAPMTSGMRSGIVIGGAHSNLRNSSTYMQSRLE